MKAALAIARFIRVRGYTTFVANNQECTSACGFIWLGGVRRVMEPDVRIGFHAAWVRSETGGADVSSVANALVGAYMQEIGLSDVAIAYLTSAAPTQFNWLNRRNARALGIQFELVEALAMIVAGLKPQDTAKPQPEPAVKPQQPLLPKPVKTLRIRVERPAGVNL